MRCERVRLKIEIAQPAALKDHCAYVPTISLRPSAVDRSLARLNFLSPKLSVSAIFIEFHTTHNIASYFNLIYVVRVELIRKQKY